MPAPTADEFATALQGRFRQASSVGCRWMYVTASDLHREVGGYPAGDGTDRMPLCVGAMRGAMRDGDSVLCEAPGGDGATLTIRYLLPRP